MGSWFSSPAAAAPAGDRRRRLVSLIPRRSIGRAMSKEMLASLGPEYYGPVFTAEEVYADCICRLAHRALKHYNANNQGAEFQYPAESTTEMKAACIGFRKQFLWYHLRFSACRGDNQEMHLFFAELCYDLDSEKITVKKLQKSLCAASKVVVHFVPRSPRLCTQAKRNLYVEKRGNKQNSSALERC